MAGQSGDASPYRRHQITTSQVPVMRHYTVGGFGLSREVLIWPGRRDHGFSGLSIRAPAFLRSRLRWLDAFSSAAALAEAVAFRAGWVNRAGDLKPKGFGYDEKESLKSCQNGAEEV